MKTLVMTAALALGMTAMSAPAFADGHAASGDAAAGESAFRQCQSCHVVENEAGEVLAGRAAKTGPNLYNIAGATAGQVEGFRYSDLLLAAGEQGIVYTEEVFVKYVMDPTGVMQELTGTDARGKMSYKVRSEEDAINLYAYIASLSSGGS